MISDYDKCFVVQITETENILFSIMWQSAERRKEGFYLTMHSTHFIYGYMASDIW